MCLSTTDWKKRPLAALDYRQMTVDYAFHILLLFKRGERFGPFNQDSDRTSDRNVIGILVIQKAFS